MSSDSFYRPPESALEREVALDGSGASIESALRGEWELPFGEIFSEAWELTRGSKGVILGATLLYLLAAMACFAVVFALGLALGDEGLGAALVNVVSGLIGPLLSPLLAGVQIYAIRRASKHEEVGFSDVMGCFAYLLPLAGLTFLTQILTGIGLTLLLLPGIYLIVAYLAAPALVVDRGLGVWEAMETSRRALSTHWFQTFFLGVLAAIVASVVTGLTLGIGMIWMAPWSTLVGAVAYRRIFGPATA